MRSMFDGCSSLKELNLSNFKTDNVDNMKEMFSGCCKMKELNLSNFNIGNETEISNMFLGCSNELIKKLKFKYKIIV